ncbi:hypothetical protein J0K78_06340 [Halobacillus sp. GSS1]|uniref:hypothetical protein n=1 Tax=Halobacillus sp. GSS1 TaxID=2815919 RepID=UPI001A90538D|nr:hypothetical protein [Halobacillus sp. GSS1]MBN9653879.1 hypothetical protein [Halobacillus sp. GSS1]
MKQPLRTQRETLELAIAQKINVLVESYRVTWVGGDPETADDRELKELIEQEIVFAEPFNGGLFVFDGK